jgi:hypothetical protein
MAKKIPQIVKYIQNNPPPEINFAFEKNISFSQASIYWQCPKRWALHYRDGHKIYEQNIYSTFGTAMHETLQMYLDVMYDESGAAADRIDLIEDFEERLRNEYKKGYKSNNSKHYSKPEQLKEFYDDGVEIINFFKKNRSKYFSKRGWHLVGCEIPIVIPPNTFLPNVKYMGYLDIVMYHEPTNTFKIIDIKTSTNGWNQKAKKDKVKQYQLVLYKKYFAEQYKVDIDTIEIEFFILRRKVWESSEFPIKRVQLFEPPSGKTSVNKASRMINEFLDDCFNREGHVTKEMPETPNNNCKWCPYYKTHLCSSTFNG